MKVLYQPGGRAREYAEWAVNLYAGCKNGCRYCYVPLLLRKTREEFHSDVRLRNGVLEQLGRDLAREKLADGTEVLLCFTCDPYPPKRDAEEMRTAIRLIGEAGLVPRILTKSGRCGDLEWIGRYGGVYGATLTTLGLAQQEWEPCAAPTTARIDVLRDAHRGGVRTWVSFEPIIVPEHTYFLLDEVLPFVDEVSFGPLNHIGHMGLDDDFLDWWKVREVDWEGVCWELERRLADAVRGGRDDLGWHVKRGLARYWPEGAELRRGQMIHSRHNGAGYRRDG